MREGANGEELWRSEVRASDQQYTVSRGGGGYIPLHVPIPYKTSSPYPLVGGWLLDES